MALTHRRNKEVQKRDSGVYPALCQMGDYNEIKYKLSSRGSVCFTHLLEVAQSCGLNNEQKNELLPLVVSKIGELIKYGNFGDLKNADKFLKELGCDNLKFADEKVKLIADLMKQFSYDFLISMSPNVYPGKKEENRIDYTRKLLIRKGAPAAQLTDEFINTLWENREMMLILHYHKVNPEKLVSMNKLLEAVKLA